MSKKISEILFVITNLIILFSSTLILFVPVLWLGLLKLIPNQPLKLLCTRTVDKIVAFWTDINNLRINKSNPVKFTVTGNVDFNPNNWYLVIANHQSWLDIVVLQHLLNRKIPVLKFFIKDQLKWVPLLGFSWWAMGCPFMKRYSKEYLNKHPHKKGKDFEATQKALKTIQMNPASVMSFIEGTRYTSQKKSSQRSPYQNLLKPKSGGISLILSAMNQHIKHLLDVTIIYPPMQHSLWEFLCHRIQNIEIHLRELPIPKRFLNASLANDNEQQSEFREWLNQEWLEKDNLIARMTTKEHNHHDNITVFN